MLWHCLKCRKNTESKIPKVLKTKRWKNHAFIKMSSVWQQKIKIIKEQEASRLFTSLGIKTHLSWIPLVGPLLFKVI